MILKVIYKTITTGSSAVVVPVTYKKTLSFTSTKENFETAPPVTIPKEKVLTETETPVTIEKEKTVTEKIEKPVTYTVVETKVVPITSVEVLTKTNPTG